MLLRCFYISRREAWVTAADIQRILFAAQIKNRRLDITGVLAQFDGHFAQVLEGHQPCVDALLQRIERDPRHREMRVLLREQIQAREYEKWHMASVSRPEFVSAIRDLHDGTPMVATDIADLVRRLMQLDDRPPWQP